jgi:hypothetical protein
MTCCKAQISLIMPVPGHTSDAVALAGGSVLAELLLIAGQPLLQLDHGVLMRVIRCATFSSFTRAQHQRCRLSG